MRSGSTVSNKETKQSSISYEKDDDISWLLENLLASSSSDIQDQPFSILLYRIGKIIYEECYKTDHNENEIQHIEQVFHEWLKSMPYPVVQTTVMDITGAFLTLLANSRTQPQSTKQQLQQLLDALFSICGLFSCSYLACQILNDYSNFTTATEFYFSLHKLYQHVQASNLFSDHPRKNHMLAAMQRIISALLLVKVKNILLQHQLDNEQEQEENIGFLHVLVNLSATDQKGLSLLLQDAIHSKIVITCCSSYDSGSNETTTIRPPVKTLKEGLERVLQKASSTDFFGAGDQYVYILTALLDSNPSDSIENVHYNVKEKRPNGTSQIASYTSKNDTLSSFSRKGSIAKSAVRAKVKINASSNTVELYIDQIKQVMPHFGDGYIELALECYGWDVETVLSKLLDSPREALHPRLQSCDTHMPRWKKQQPQEESLHPDEEAKKTQLRYFKALEDQEELDMYIIERIDGENEYDDDYDDQYDDAVGAGDVSGPATMMDDAYYDHIRRYNTLRRSEENEAKFWVS